MMDSKASSIQSDTKFKNQTPISPSNNTASAKLEIPSTPTKSAAATTSSTTTTPTAKSRKRISNVSRQKQEEGLNIEHLHHEE
eukprot:Pgem_evm2s18960